MAPLQTFHVSRGMNNTGTRRITMRDPIWRWPFPTTHCQLILNRQTPFHRDGNSFPPFIDMLVSVPQVDIDLVLALRTLGVSLPYGNGSVVGLLAAVIEHGVPEVEGHRFALALFHRKEVVTDWVSEAGATGMMHTIYNVMQDAGLNV